MHEEYVILLPNWWGMNVYTSFLVITIVHLGAPIGLNMYLTLVMNRKLLDESIKRYLLWDFGDRRVVFLSVYDSMSSIRNNNYIIPNWENGIFNRQLPLQKFYGYIALDILPIWNFDLGFRTNSELLQYDVTHNSCFTIFS